MAKLTRLDQKIFASDAGAEEVTAFGSAAAGNPVYITDASGVQTELFEKGWNSAVIGETNPIMDDRNAVDMLFSRQLAYLYQTGIPAYSATDTYYKGSIVSFYSTEDDALKLYYSIIDDNTGNSLDDADKWVEWKSGGGGASLPILTYQFSDHELNSVSWVKSCFSWLNGSIYLAAYKHLQADIGFRYVSSTLTVSHPDFTAGTYVRISTLDKMIDSTDYYAWGISGTTEDTKCVYTLTTMLADGVKTYFYKNSAMQQLTSCIVESQSETISGTTISYFRAQDGHKIVLDDQATNVASIYSATGVAWYYIFDDTNTRFKLPRSNWNFKGTSNDDVGDFVDESLPNITGAVGGTYTKATGGVSAGAFGEGTTTGGNTAAGNNYGSVQITFDASKSSSTYQDSAPVQPRATKAYLYFYVGNFEQSAIEQTAGINAEDFQQKADTDLGNVTHNGSAQIAHFAYPSNTALPLTWGSSGDDFTAVTDGWVCASRNSTAQYQGLLIQSYTPGGALLMQDYFRDAVSGSPLTVSLPVSSGQKFKVTWDNGSTAGIFQFIYAKGNEPQA